MHNHLKKHILTHILDDKIHVKTSCIYKVCYFTANTNDSCGVMVSALDYYPGDQGLIPCQVKMFINLKCSFRMTPWESLHTSGPTAPAVPHPLCVKCCVRY